jgi:TetR/AcrR family transcriptional regulator, fatty acid metabolism regulator protein
MADTPKRGGDKRERILAAAVKTFAKSGFYNAKVSEVASAAGVADGTIYLYFKNKDDLLISAFEDRMQMLNERLRQELARTEGPTVIKLRKCLQLHLLLAIEAPDLAEFITVELRQSSKFIKEYDNQKFHEYLEIVVDVIKEGQRAGEMRGDMEPWIATRALFGALDEMLLALVLRKEVTPELVESRVAALERLFVDGLRPRHNP